METEKEVVGEWLIFASCGGWAQLCLWNPEQWTALKTNFSHILQCSVSYLFWVAAGCCLASVNGKASVYKGEGAAFLVSYLSYLVRFSYWQQLSNFWLVCYHGDLGSHWKHHFGFPKSFISVSLPVWGDSLSHMYRVPWNGCVTAQTIVWSVSLRAYFP